MEDADLPQAVSRGAQRQAGHQCIPVLAPDRLTRDSVRSIHADDGPRTFANDDRQELRLHFENP